jgi:hypothetical protein
VAGGVGSLRGSGPLSAHRYSVRISGGDAQGELRIGLVKERMRQLGWELGTKLEILAFYSGAEPDFASAGELPTQAPNKFELIINQKTARDLSIAIPMQLLASADEVIE